MAEKPPTGPAARIGGGGPARVVATSGCAAVGCAALDRATLVAACGTTKARSRRLGRSLVATEADAADEGSVGSARSRVATATSTWRVGRGRSRGHSTRVARRRCLVVSCRANHRTHPGATRSLGRSAPSASFSASQGMARSRRGRSQGRIGFVRYRRRTGHSWRTAPDNSHGNVAARRVAGGLAVHLRRCHPGGGIPDRALAGFRSARIRPVRQRQSIHRPAPASRRGGSCHSPVPEPRRHARFRAAQRNGIPGRYRELQRTLAGQGLATLRTSRRGATAATIQRLPGGTASTSSGPHRRGAAPSCVSRSLEIQSSSSAARTNLLHPAHYRQRPGHHPGTLALRQSPMATSAGPRRSRPRSQLHPILRPPTPTT